MSHKALVGDPDDDPGVGAPTWCPPSESRRVRAYLARAAYLGGNARLLLPPTTSDKAIANRREYGDPAYIVDRIVAAVLGDGATWTVDGADEDIPDEPDLPPTPTEPGEDATDLERRIFDVRLARWEAQAEEAFAAWVDAWATQPALRQRQDELRAWVTRAGIDAVVHETEHDTAGLGDSVVVLWHQAGDWPRPEIIPPEAYFPVRGEHDDGAFPSKVHLAWEFTLDVVDGGVWVERRFLRRVTFELAELAELRSVPVDGTFRAWAGADGMPADAPTLRPDEAVEVDLDRGAFVTRAYPWDRPAEDEAGEAVDLTETAEDREPSRIVCLYSDGTWALDDVTTRLDDLDEAAAVWRPYGEGLAYRADYGIDFLPVLHTPNTPTGKEHWGRSVIDLVVQVLDDLAGADTAAASASRYLKDPTVALEGAELPEGQAPIMVPGHILTGKLTPLDLSLGLEKLMDYRESLRDRAATNVSLPADLLGRTEDGGPESGFSRLIRWTPFAQTVGSLRMVRKWHLFAKMAQRMAQVQGVLPAGPTPAVRLAWGSFLPTDKGETLRMVAEGLDAHAISPQVATTLLVAAGFPIDDARAELDRIKAANTAAAREAADATGSERVAAEWLGVELDDAGPAPVLDLPPVPPTEDDET